MVDPDPDPEPILPAETAETELASETETLSQGSPLQRRYSDDFEEFDEPFEYEDTFEDEKSEKTPAHQVWMAAWDCWFVIQVLLVCIPPISMLSFCVFKSHVPFGNMQTYFSIYVCILYALAWWWISVNVCQCGQSFHCNDSEVTACHTKRWFASTQILNGPGISTCIYPLNYPMYYIFNIYMYVYIYTPLYTINWVFGIAISLS